MCKTYDEPDSPDEEACVRYMMLRKWKLICMGLVFFVRVIASFKFHLAIATRGGV